MSELGFSNNGASQDQTGTNGPDSEALKNYSTLSDQLDQAVKLIDEGEPDDRKISKGEEGEEGGPAEVLPLRSDQDSEGEESKTGAAGEEGPESLKDLVEDLGTSYKNVYDKMKVPLPDGSEKTLGELKDAFQDREALISESVASREALRAERAEIIKAQQTVEMLLPYAQEIAPEVQDQLKSQYEAKIQSETQALHRAMPELRNQNAFQTFSDGVLDHMAGFGFKPEELNISDHRMLVFIKQAMDDRAYLERLAGMKPEPIAAQKKPRKTRNATKGDAVKPGDRNDQLDRIASLIGG